MFKKRLCGVKQFDVHKLALWLAAKKFQPWVRAKNDCCTLFMEYHDWRFGTNKLADIYGKYHDLRTAIKYASKFPKVDEWFPDNGYYQVDEPISGDIIMVNNNRWFPSSYIVLWNCAWGIQDNAKMMSRHQLVEPQQEYSIWRHKHGS